MVGPGTTAPAYLSPITLSAPKAPAPAKPFHRSAELSSLHGTDLEDVLAIEESVQIHPWSKAQLAQAIAADYCPCLREAVAKGQGRGSQGAQRALLAYAIVAEVLDEWHLHNISVARSVQGRGLGAQLLAQVLAEAKQAQVKSILLEVRSSNGVAQTLYRKAGFKLVGRRRNYYSLPGPGQSTPQEFEDALLYSCLL